MNVEITNITEGDKTYQVRSFLGDQFWYFNKVLHRDNGPAIIRITGNGETKEWWHHGKLHREDGPAIEGVEKKYLWWYRDGKLHREDGPALIIDGQEKWYLEGVRLSKEDWESWVLGNSILSDLEEENSILTTILQKKK